MLAKQSFLVKRTQRVKICNSVLLQDNEFFLSNSFQKLSFYLFAQIYSSEFNSNKKIYINRINAPFPNSNLMTSSRFRIIFWKKFLFHRIVNDLNIDFPVFSAEAFQFFKSQGNEAKYDKHNIKACVHYFLSIFHFFTKS